MSMRLRFEMFDNKDIAPLSMDNNGEYDMDILEELPYVTIGSISNCYVLSEELAGVMNAPQDCEFYDRPVTKEQLELFLTKLTEPTCYQFNPVKDMVERALKVDFDKFTILVTWC